ncbi:hypothetical protein Anas_08106 [Armadillidium nasatum]|uniref:Uncharacterized protein n=1 Tax=Armadillidium nasatum TaxID=96803 RepID=A0A5N5SIK8_9CRUS|nr:hypothetical protein Anas_08106 [Armadillidium nasatum]
MNSLFCLYIEEKLKASLYYLRISLLATDPFLIIIYSHFIICFCICIRMHLLRHQEILYPCVLLMTCKANADASEEKQARSAIHSVQNRARGIRDEGSYLAVLLKLIITSFFLKIVTYSELANRFKVSVTYRSKHFEILKSDSKVRRSSIKTVKTNKLLKSLNKKHHEVQ